MIKALLFDFDGLILDTETPSFEAWVQIYREHYAELAWEDYIHCVGTHNTAFDAVDNLQKTTGTILDRAKLNQQHVDIALGRIKVLPPLPGVVEILKEARLTGLKTVVASSSSREWVLGNLERLKIEGLFDALVNRGDVKNVKPAPDLFLRALSLTGAEASEAIVFEDSLNGIRAAHSAGIYCVAVPNAVTKALPLHEADLLINSLQEKTLPEMLELASGSRWGTLI